MSSARHPPTATMTELTVEVDRVDGRTQALTLEVARVANLGLAGREPPPDDRLEELLDRMQAAGVDRPSELPTVVPKPAHLVTTDRTIQVNGSETAGEVEFVLFPTEDGTYVGVGNDHKDRTLDGHAMHVANSTCPSVVADHVWRLDEIEDHWDELELRSWVEVDGALREHQRAAVSAFMRPETLLDRVERRLREPLVGTAVWSGTVGVGDDAVDPFPAVVPGSFYLLQLYDPVLDRRLVASYEVRLNDWVEGLRLDRQG